MSQLVPETLQRLELKTLVTWVRQTSATSGRCSLLRRPPHGSGRQELVLICTSHAEIEI